MTFSENSSLSLYVHVPFCKTLCAYCDFPRVPFDPETARRVLERMIEIIESLPAGFGGIPVSTVFFGGGTPSILPRGTVGALLRSMRGVFALAPDAEISLEANPEDVSADWVEEMRAAGVNRFSCGVQSFVCTQALNRRHTPQRAVAAVEELRRQGVDNLNLDMMFALPEQRLADLDRDIDALLRLSPEHVSWYALTLAPRTPLEAAVRAGRWRLPGESLWLAMYERIQERLEKAGYEHYEISNWARPGKACRHNWRIWMGADYIGFGPGAASRFRRWRWKEPFPPEIFLDTAEPACWKEPGPPPWAMDAEIVDETGEDLETLLTGVRLPEGFDLRRLHGEIDPGCICSLQSQGLLWQTGHRIGPTRKGLSLSDTVLALLADGLRCRRPPSCP